jgi:D-alanyl-D-alanine carboxypeptidase/D-alanyl-D-alanine-endopeptidase (penicillin-binding protein 4)
VREPGGSVLRLLIGALVPTLLGLTAVAGLAPAAGSPSAADSTPTTGSVRWEQGLERALSVRALRGARVAAIVVRENDGEVLFARDPDRALVPASNLKILTAIAALDAFGPSHRFVTRFASEAPPDAAGRLHSLFVQGGGDPVLNSEDWWQIASQLREAGVREIQGDLVLDASAFDGQRWHPKWGRTSSRAYHAPVAGLTANYGAFKVVVRPGEHPGDAVTVAIDPPVDHLRVSNRARTGEANARRSLVIDRVAGAVGERVLVEGVLPAGAAPVAVHRSVLDPVAYAGSLLRWQLASQGILVGGRVRVGPAPANAREILAFPGRALSEIVRLFLKYSNNQVAEALVKAQSRRVDSRPGNWPTGLLAQRRQLEEAGLWAPGARIVDGSGLGYGNRLTPRMLAEALVYASDSFRFGPEFRAALPIAGRDGTLEERGEEAPGQVRAKTGLLTRVVALSGFARSPTGEERIFSILVNGYRGSDEAAMDAVDGFAAAVAGEPAATLR